MPRRWRSRPSQSERAVVAPRSAFRDRLAHACNHRRRARPRFARHASCAGGLPPATGQHRVRAMTRPASARKPELALSDRPGSTKHALNLFACRRPTATWGPPLNAPEASSLTTDWTDSTGSSRKGAFPDATAPFPALAFSSLPRRHTRPAGDAKKIPALHAHFPDVHAASVALHKRRNAVHVR